MMRRTRPHQQQHQEHQRSQASSSESPPFWRSSSSSSSSSSSFSASFAGKTDRQTKSHRPPAAHTSSESRSEEARRRKAEKRTKRPERENSVRAHSVPQLLCRNPSSPVLVSVRVLVCACVWYSVCGTVCVCARQEKQQGGTHPRGVWEAHVKNTRPAAEILADGERKHGASEQTIRAAETSRAFNGTEKDPSLLRRITAPQ